MSLLEWTEDIRKTFWSNKFWFPHNYTWEVFELKTSGPYKDIYYPQFRDLLVPFVVALGLVILRCILNQLVFRPIGRYYRLKEGRLFVPESIPILQKSYKYNKRPKHTDVEELANKLNWTTRSVERWFRKRRNYDKSSTMKKFCETCWRWSFYFTIHLVGLYILYDEPMVYNMNLVWDGWPHHHHVTNEFYIYYMLELGFYWSLLMTMTYDVKRSDYIEHCIHHIITISLLYFSWISNFVRVGVLVLGLHDAVDHWLEGAKIFKYLRYEKTCDFLFAMFTIVWIVTRLYVFPTTIVMSCWEQVMGPFPAFTVYLVFLSALQLMHIAWTVPLLRGVHRAVTKRNVEDVRSASELSSFSDENGTVITNGLHHDHDNHNHIHNNHNHNHNKTD